MPWTIVGVGEAVADVVDRTVVVAVDFACVGVILLTAWLGVERVVTRTAAFDEETDLAGAVPNLEPTATTSAADELGSAESAAAYTVPAASDCPVFVSTPVGETFAVEEAAPVA